MNSRYHCKESKRLNRPSLNLFPFLTRTLKIPDHWYVENYSQNQSYDHLRPRTMWVYPSMLQMQATEIRR